MVLLSTFLIAIGLAMDCFAVSLAIGTAQANTARSIFRIAFHFGLFQGVMTLLGWLAGSTIAHLISGMDHWIAMVLLAWVGIRMLREGFEKEEEAEKFKTDPSRGGTLMMLCVATSIDALAVGLSVAMMKVDILSASLIIAGVSLALSLVGLLTGNLLGKRFGKQMEVVGGLLLIGIGVRVVITHIMAV